MPQPAPSPPPSSPTSFAGLLASFATPGQKKPPARDPGLTKARDRAHDADGLEDDVATLSYERALRAHARYHAPEEAPQPTGPAAAEAAGAAYPRAAGPEPALRDASLPLAGFASAAFALHETEPVRIFEADPAWTEDAPPAAAAQAEKIPAAQFAADAGEAPGGQALGGQALGGQDLAGRQPLTGRHQPAGADPPTALDRNLKTASITIRLSPSECAQLRRRAAEAGLTVSAYLRSCTFETEALRTLVKDTLAKMRVDTAHAEGLAADAPRADALRAGDRRDLPATPGLLRRLWQELKARYWPHARVSRRVAQA